MFGRIFVHGFAVYLVCFQNFFHPQESEKPEFLNSSRLKGVSGKLRFRDG